MSESLEGTVALVTGASSGIGEATALALADAGADVAIVARRVDRLEDLAGRIEASGRRGLAIEADLTDRAQAEAAVERAADHFGRIDTLFNNAGVMLLSPLAMQEVDDFERMIDINLKGLLYTAKAALPHLTVAAQTSPRGVADLINVSSVAGRVARAYTSVYNMTKFGVAAFSEALRQELVSQHVRVSSVEPGAVATELTDHLNPQAKQGFEQRFSDVEVLESADIADAVTYIVTRPRRMAVNEILIRPTEQVG
ncbi:MAG: SDR family NAD(P)-dependent oxidoreductase [Solirubrobacterales bacterium]